MIIERYLGGMGAETPIIAAGGFESRGGAPRSYRFLRQYKVIESVSGNNLTTKV